MIIGDNGAGKSTVLRAIALALVGTKNAEALRQDWATWVRCGEESAKIKVVVTQYRSDDKWSKQGQPLKNYNPEVGLNFTTVEQKTELVAIPLAHDPLRHVWSGKEGWFSASFGPFRRFSGGDKDEEKLFYSHPQLARHLSVFGENVALSECIAWLQQLRFNQLDNDKKSGQLLVDIRKFINQPGFLPHGVRLESVTSKAVSFIDGNGVKVPVTALGDGFRSILSLTFELVRQMSAAWPHGSIFEHKDDFTTVKRSGVVLIDEIDAHLHPSWQRLIGFWLTKHFPKLQFIVTTHSPLVCHAAEYGSIFRLATPGTDELARMPSGLERDRLIFGSVLDAYGTELFGKDVSRSEAAQKKQARLAELNQKALSANLVTRELSEQRSLQALFPASM